MHEHITNRQITMYEIFTFQIRQCRAQLIGVEYEFGQVDRAPVRLQKLF